MAQITTSEFATELGTDGRTARKFLRSITPVEEHPGKGSRWVIEGNKRAITKMKKNFAEWSAATAKPEQDAPAEIEEPTDEPTAAEVQEIEDDELALDED